ncbi:hypothetical protein H112_01405 [Trichophyton rubrum D6]|uniref:Uncharacterized protein n=3 Tax=Trichophyton TaxID=5550 RepID=F2SWV3_TRIRC|nr:uncharacterized protein TERG_07052 [Trichophyton rubrum CBS 118892]EZF26536.1 hypothetical protein H100_01400 [Trichophyton rubrum MR850]EZF45514.1 hypothetical protein H102_01395 [Trichophyton rubrum CBS 100081]EZF56161.1 hypothetical protein H103_01405 [Trichophyton rubrum CBS 288.86]EZF66772.1 hypothetical protein H104_01385 [Trichophyton rubrum CBS 289.86]EZF77405.1 hypothetical protein H105_01415 [Trichophyton soudanense CBS 452.61]EZF88060.1 hypothetical protein H110_01404 [Trichophy
MTGIIFNILQTLYPYCSSLSGLISNMDWEEIVLVLATSWVTLRLLGIGLNFEQLFDLLGINGISDRIRAVKGWFLLPESHEQLKWIERMNEERAYNILRTQQSLAIKDLTIEHAIQRKLDVLSNLWNTGPKDWKHKLLEMRCLEWIDRNQEFALHLRKPEGPFTRQYERQQERKHKALATNPTKYLSQPHLVEECKTRGGCCARACQCCLRPRGLYPDKTVLYSHCTTVCGCCVRNRGFVHIDQSDAREIPDFVDCRKWTYHIEERPCEATVL